MTGKTVEDLFLIDDLVASGSPFPRSLAKSLREVETHEEVEQIRSLMLRAIDGP